MWWNSARWFLLLILLWLTSLSLVNVNLLGHFLYMALVQYFLDRWLGFHELINVFTLQTSQTDNFYLVAFWTLLLNIDEVVNLDLGRRCWL